MNIASKVKNIFQRLLGAIPSSLPVGVTEFNSWADSIIQVYSLPMDERSAKFGLCALLMRLGQTEAYKSKRFFALCLHKGAASQIAAYVMEDIKNQQKAEHEAQLAAASTLAPTTEVPVAEGTSSVTPPVSN